MDYKNGKIYKLVCSETQQIYIGSTCSTLVKRLSQHKCKKNKCKSKSFINPKIFLIEDFPCERKEQLLAREREHIENNYCVNLQKPGRTQIQYYYEKIEECKKMRKEYALKNPEKMKEIKRKHYEKNKQLFKERSIINNKIKITCECGCVILKNNIKAHKKTKKHYQRMNQA